MPPTAEGRIVFCASGSDNSAARRGASFERRCDTCAACDRTDNDTAKARGLRHKVVTQLRQHLCSTKLSAVPVCDMHGRAAHEILVQDFGWRGLRQL
jgi:hypothetical protein